MTQVSFLKYPVISNEMSLFIRFNEPSFSYRSKQRALRGILPVRQQETNQVNYDRFRVRKSEQTQYQLGQDLPKLPVGSNVLYSSHIRNLWSPGVIVDRVHDRSYTIISQKGRIFNFHLALWSPDGRWGGGVNPWPWGHEFYDIGGLIEYKDTCTSLLTA